MIPKSVRIWVCTTPVDMRKSFDGLAAATRDLLDKDAERDGLFVFVNKRGNRLKALWWDKSGYALLYKRLEWGQFRLPAPLRQGEAGVQIQGGELSKLLEGFGRPSKRHRLYERVVRDMGLSSLQRRS